MHPALVCPAQALLADLGQLIQQVQEAQEPWMGRCKIVACAPEEFEVAVPCACCLYATHLVLPTIRCDVCGLLTACLGLQVLFVDLDGMQHGVGGLESQHEAVLGAHVLAGGRSLQGVWSQRGLCTPSGHCLALLHPLTGHATFRASYTCMMQLATRCATAIHTKRLCESFSWQRSCFLPAFQLHGQCTINSRASTALPAQAASRPGVG